MQYRLFVDLEAIQFLASSKPSLRRKLVAHLSKIEAFPESSSDYCSGSAIHYWTYFADRHVKVLRISQADS